MFFNVLLKKKSVVTASLHICKTSPYVYLSRIQMILVCANHSCVCLCVCCFINVICFFCIFSLHVQELQSHHQWFLVRLKSMGNFLAANFVYSIFKPPSLSDSIHNNTVTEKKYTELIFFAKIYIQGLFLLSSVYVLFFILANHIF